MSLDDRLRAYAALVGLIFILLTVFTGQRMTRLQELERAPGTGARDARLELVLVAGLLLGSTLVFVTGLPLLKEVLHHMDLGGKSGPLRSAFFVSWLLFLGLIGWQVVLLKRAWSVKKQAAA